MLQDTILRSYIGYIVTRRVYIGTECFESTSCFLLRSTLRYVQEESNRRCIYMMELRTVGTATRFTTGVPQQKRHWYHLRSVLAAFGAHSASYPVGN
jgi:hypothetical protein